ncbi:MAG: hypothetical protein NTU47_13275 [Ignavibacteriales bacterium]|nr:hypothetical protein [Ignavibacteriales bacterium]
MSSNSLQLKNIRLLTLGLLMLVAGVFLNSGCDQSFDPQGPLDKRMVVFSVLSTDHKNQYVLVQQSYSVPDYNPLSHTTDNSLDDVRVALNASNGSYFFADTLLPRQDTSRYNFPIRSFVLRDFTPIGEATYEMVIQSRRYGLASASVTVPGSSQISRSQGVEQALNTPRDYPNDFQLSFVVGLSPAAKGILSRLLLYYDVQKGNQWFSERVEVPLNSADSTLYTLDHAVYPQLAATPATSRIALNYKNGYYRAIVYWVNSKYPTNRVIFKWVTLVILQGDKNLVQYYTSVHPSFDPYSIRLDESIASPVNGSLGLIGGYNLDSLVQLLPANFWGNK